jgi:hypothetical protein
MKADKLETGVFWEELRIEDGDCGGWQARKPRGVLLWSSCRPPQILVSPDDTVHPAAIGLSIRRMLH